LPVIVTNIHTKEKLTYVSLTEAGKALNVSRAAVSQALIHNRLIKKTYAISKEK
jgi:biotin operon repressor